MCNITSSDWPHICSRLRGPAVSTRGSEHAGTVCGTGQGKTPRGESGGAAIRSASPRPLLRRPGCCAACGGCGSVTGLCWKWVRLCMRALPAEAACVSTSSKETKPFLPQRRRSWRKG